MPDVSRRGLLRGVTLASAAAVGGTAGAGTYALFNDGELFPANGLASGALDLEVATKTVAPNGDTTTTPPQPAPSFPSEFASETTATVVFPDVAPSNGPVSGTATVAFRVCDNPGRVWLRARGADSALADAADATLRYAQHCGNPGSVIYDGALSGLFDALGSGVLLGASCQRLGKIETVGDTFVVEGATGDGSTLAFDDVPGTLTLPGPDGPVTVTVTRLYWKDEGSEVAGVDLESNDTRFCRVDAKGGPGAETYRFDCGNAATGVLAPVNSKNGKRYGLSHFAVYACGSGDCIGCTPACLTLDWQIDDPESVAGSSLSFDLDLFARQCRHDNLENPWS